MTTLAEDVLGLLAREYLRDDDSAAFTASEFRIERALTITQIKRALGASDCTVRPGGHTGTAIRERHKQAGCVLGVLYTLEEGGMVERAPLGSWGLSPRAEDAALRLVSAS